MTRATGNALPGTTKVTKVTTATTALRCASSDRSFAQGTRRDQPPSIAQIGAPDARHETLGRGDVPVLTDSRAGDGALAVDAILGENGIGARRTITLEGLVGHRPSDPA